jgi:hypothetical protein
MRLQFERKAIQPRHRILGIDVAKLIKLRRCCLSADNVAAKEE